MLGQDFDAFERDPHHRQSAGCRAHRMTALVPKSSLVSCYVLLHFFITKFTYEVWIFLQLRKPQSLSIYVHPSIFSGIGKLRGRDANNRAVLIVQLLDSIWKNSSNEVKEQRYSAG